MRLKVGFILRSLLVIGTFLGLVVLWSSLSPKPQDENPFAKRVSGSGDRTGPDRTGGGDLTRSDSRNTYH